MTQMKIDQFSEVRLRNFRCFGSRQTARLRPLTLLVGDNSTGKTSFLAAVRAIWDAVHQQTEPDFRAAPYDLGAFQEIVFSEGESKGGGSFEIGFSGLSRRGRKFDADITFDSRSAVPFPAIVSLKTEKAWITYEPEEDNEIIVKFGSRDNSWRFRLDRERFPIIPFEPLFFIDFAIRSLNDLAIPLNKVCGTMDEPDADTIETVSNMLTDVSFRRGKPFASAPIRSSPHRTYDPTKPLPDPEGSYVPTYFASVNFRDKDQWNRLKDNLEGFGKASGLFHEIEVKQLGDMEGGPFQLEIGIGGTGKAGRRNLIDVGYGVSQALPVLAEIIRPDAPQMVLFQQPEVHLHPSAQAALGSLFCSAAAAGRQLIVETHSEYIMDRVRMDLRDRKTELTPDDVSILFFERSDLGVRIHSLKFDKQGNVLNAPESYGRFFMNETRRSVGL